MLLVGQIGLIGISDIFCRVGLRHKGVDISIFTPLLALSILIPLLLSYLVMIKNGGYDFHVMVK